MLSAALSRLGAVQNPIIHLYREREVGFALRQTGARSFFVPGEFKGFDFPEFAARVTARARRSAGDRRRGPRSPRRRAPRRRPIVAATATTGARPDETPVRWIYYTSGTTADPKGVRHTDQTLIAGGWGLAVALDVSPDDVGSIAFPYAHIGGPDYLVTMLSLGFNTVLVDAFVPGDVIPLFRRHGVTMVGGSTAFYVAFLAEQRKQPDDPIMPSLRLMSGGGAPKPPELHYEVQREIGGRGVVHGYGMTEVPMIAQGSPARHRRAAGEHRREAGGRRARSSIVRLDGTVAGPEEDGEVRVRGPMVFRGYTDPALDADAFDEDGYFRTGDLGQLRPDGHVVLTGRLKDVIIRKGENICAKEIEDLLYTHPKVEDVAVIGLPDPERGERVCAVVQLADGVDTLDFDEMVAFCKDAGLMTQKVPEQLEVRTEMPRAATGKIVKARLRDEYAG